MLRNSRGVSLAELVVAMVIMTTCVLAGMSSFRYITMGIRQSRAKTIASNLVAERMEVLKNLSYFQLLVTTSTASNTDYDPDIVFDRVNYTSETITLWGLPPFTRAVHVSYVTISSGVVSRVAGATADTGVKEVTVFVLWDEGNDHKKTEVHNLFSNPNAASLNSGFQGRVKGPGASSLAGAEISIIGASQWKTTSNTDMAINYTLPVAAGTYNLLFSAPGYYSQTVNGASCTNAAYTTLTNVELVKISSGGVDGTVWISTNIVISAVVASSGTGVDREYVEIYNPTTYTWLMDAANFMLMYKENSGSADVPFTLNFISSAIAPNSFYLIASEPTVTINGVTKTADATYNCAVMGGTCPDVILGGDYGGDNGAVGLINMAAEIIHDRVAWGWNPFPDAPPQGTEGSSAKLIDGGLADSMILYRYTSTGTLNLSLGNAYDTDQTSSNFTAVYSTDSALYVPRNTGDVLLAVSGRPAHSAVVMVDDPLSASTRAVTYNLGTNTEYAYFQLPAVSTGTWTVEITSGSYYLSVENVTVSQSESVSTSATNGATTPSWPVEGFPVSVLTSTSAGGLVQGYVYGAGASYWTPLSNILVEAGGVQKRTDSNGYYIMTTSTGTVTVRANLNQDNSNYSVDSQDAVVTAGGIVTAPAYPHFHLSNSGRIQVYFTSGSGALPNITVKAVNGVFVFTATSDYTGYAYIPADAPFTYTVSPLLDVMQSASPTSVSTETVSGGTVFAGTFTITGGLGSIAGSVTENGEPITTGVLVVVSNVAGITDPPPLLYGATAQSMANVYYAASSQADGSYSVDVRAGSYNMKAFYPKVDTAGGSVAYSWRMKTNVNVIAGARTGGQNFSW